MAEQVKAAVRAEIGEEGGEEIDPAVDIHPRLERCYTRPAKSQIDKRELIDVEHNPCSPKRKRRGLVQLSAQTRVDIAKMISSGKRPHKEIADLFDVSTLVVTKISGALKRNSDLFVKRRARELRKAQQQAGILSVARGMIDERKSIWTVKQLQGAVKQEVGIDVSSAAVRLVLRKTMKMSYRVIKRAPFAGNSPRSKTLRSLYAQRMLPIYSEH